MGGILCAGSKVARRQMLDAWVEEDRSERVCCRGIIPFYFVNKYCKQDTFNSPLACCIISCPIMGASAYISGVHLVLYSSGRTVGSQVEGTNIHIPLGLRSVVAYFNATAAVRFPPA